MPAHIVAFLTGNVSSFRNMTPGGEARTIASTGALAEQLAALPKPIAWRRVDTADGGALEAYPIRDERLRHARDGAMDQAFGPGGFLSRLEASRRVHTGYAATVRLDVEAGMALAWTRAV